MRVERLSKKRNLKMKSSPGTCPTCGDRLIPMAYGYPTIELLEAADRGEVRLGGCCIMNNSPSFACSCDEIRTEEAIVRAKASPGRRPRA